jgi:hypothetical protein
VTEIVGNPAAAGIDDLVEPIGAIVSIALGVLCGVALPWDCRGAVAAAAAWRDG